MSSCISASEAQEGVTASRSQYKGDHSLSVREGQEPLGILGICVLLRLKKGNDQGFVFPLVMHVTAKQGIPDGDSVSWKGA